MKKAQKMIACVGFAEGVGNYLTVQRAQQLSTLAVCRWTPIPRENGYVGHVHARFVEGLTLPGRASTTIRSYYLIIATRNITWADIGTASNLK